MASLNSVSVSPNSVALGGTATVTVGVATDPGAPGRQVEITATVDGETGSGVVLVGQRSPEIVEFSTDAARVDEQGVCVVTVDEGSVASQGNGVFIYTAPSA